MFVRLVRSKDRFFEKISLRDPKTVESYVTRIANFENFCNRQFKVEDIVPKISDESEIYDVLQSWINDFSKTHQPSTTWNYFSSIKKYLNYRGFKITKDDIDNYLDLPRKHEKELHPLQLEEVRRILDELSYKDQTLFLCQLSSGMRIGELVQLKKKHLVLDEERIIVKIPSMIAKFKRGRTTFLSKEAGIKLRAILKKLDDDDQIFGTNKDVRKSETNKGQILRDALERIGLNMRYEETGFYKINTHSFRAYFITRISRHDPNLAKFFAGEKGYLLQYDRLTDEEKLEKYLEFEIDLLVYDNSKTTLQIEKLKKEKSELRKLNEEKGKIIEDYKKLEARTRRLEQSSSLIQQNV